MKYLTLNQIKKYHKNGFLLAKGIFTKKECETFKKILSNEINKGKKVYKKYAKKSKKTNHNSNKLKDIPRKINQGFLQDIAHRNTKIMKLANNKKITSLVHQIFGDQDKMYRLYRSLSIFKTKDISNRTPWHQDMPYWKGSPNKLSIWISLDKVTRKSGSICYIPGSHKKIYKHVKTNSYLVTKNVDEKKRVSVETEKGDILIHHSMIIHGSEENILRKSRFALIFTYQPAIDLSHHRSGSAKLIEHRVKN